jgi:hypothetical protein
MPSNIFLGNVRYQNELLLKSASRLLLLNKALRKKQMQNLANRKANIKNKLPKQTILSHLINNTTNTTNTSESNSTQVSILRRLITSS